MRSASRDPDRWLFKCAFLVRVHAEKLVPNEDAYCMGRVETESNTRDYSVNSLSESLIGIFPIGKSDATSEILGISSRLSESEDKVLKIIIKKVNYLSNF